MLLAHQRQEIGLSVAVEIVHRHVDRAGPRIKLLLHEAQRPTGRAGVPQQENAARPIPTELRHDQVQIGVAIDVHRPRVGNAPQSRGYDDGLELSSIPPPQPNHAAPIMVDRRITSQVGNDQVHDSIAVQVARLEMAGVVQARQPAHRTPLKVMCRNLSRGHVARQEHRILAALQSRPTQIGDRRFRLIGCQRQRLALKTHPKRAIGHRRRGVHDPLRGPRSIVRDDLLHRRRREIGAARFRVELVSFAHAIVPCIAWKARRTRQRVAIAAEGPNPNLGVSLLRCGAYLRTGSSLQRFLTRAETPPRHHRACAQHQHGCNRPTANGRRFPLGCHLHEPMNLLSLRQPHSKGHGRGLPEIYPTARGLPQHAGCRHRDGLRVVSPQHGD